MGFGAAIFAVLLSGVALTASVHSGPFLILAISIAHIFTGVRGIIHDTQSAKWPSVEATVLDIREDRIDVIMHSYAQRYFYPKIRYQYAFQGVEYISDIVSFQVANIWVPEYDCRGIITDEKARFWYGWKEGEKIAAYVNTRNPVESAIINKVGKKIRSQQIALVVGGVLIGAVWFFLISM